jgi:peptide/nickel transport system permease protein
MKRYIIKRILAFFPVMIGVSVVCFSLTLLIPGDIIDIMSGSEKLSPEAEAKMRSDLGLDKPVHLRYLYWMGNVLKGNLGKSWSTGMPVLSQILQRLPVNIELLIIALSFAILFGIILGMVAAALENTGWDYAIRFFAILGYSIPNFWLGTIIILIGTLYLPSLPLLEYVPFFENPWQNIRGIILPGLTLGLFAQAFIVRMTRSSFLEQVRQNYVRTARAKGLPEKVVFTGHLLKNSLIPVVTIIGMQVGWLIGGVVLVEDVFILPGLGALLLDAIQLRDFNVIQGVILLLSIVFLISNLLVDILYAWLDPRIKY